MKDELKITMATVLSYHAGSGDLRIEDSNEMQSPRRKGAKMQRRKIVFFFVPLRLCVFAVRFCRERLNACLFSLILSSFILLPSSFALADRIHEPIAGPQFDLTDHNDKTFGNGDLKGHVWVADFIFTNCGGPCPAMTQKMVAAMKRIKDPEVRFISFSVDPTRDVPSVLRTYAQAQGATDPRLHFLTGTEAQIQAVARQLLQTIIPATSKEPIVHSRTFIILDKDNQIRAIFDPIEPGGIDQVVSEVEFVLSGRPIPPEIASAQAAPPPAPSEHDAFLIRRLPAVNASLNALSAIFLCAGFMLVLFRRYAAHAVMMITAFISSAVFLVCYLTLHYVKLKAGVGISRFPESGLRPVYLTILTSHTILAVAVLPMILTTFYRAFTRQWEKHRRLARPTFWIWLYVSVTGVVVYWMLYHLAPGLAG